MSPSSASEREYSSRSREKGRSKDRPLGTPIPSTSTTSLHRPHTGTSSTGVSSYVSSSHSHYPTYEQQQQDFSRYASSQAHKSKKNVVVPKLTIKKVNEDIYRNPPSAVEMATSTTTSTPSTSFSSKFGRGRSKKSSPTTSKPDTPATESSGGSSLRGTPFQPSSPSHSQNSVSQGQEPHHHHRQHKEQKEHKEYKECKEPKEQRGRSSSSDGRILSKMKASKNAIQSQHLKWSQKSQAAWGKIKGSSSKETPKSAVFAPPGYGSFGKTPVEVFGISLKEATIQTRVAKERVEDADNTAYWVPALVYRCVTYLNVHGPQELGIYRVPGSTAAVEELRTNFKHMHDVDLFKKPPDDVNTVCSMLKQYFRDLPEMLIPEPMQRSIYEQVKHNIDPKNPPQIFLDVLSSLPPYNYYTLRTLTQHLSKVNHASNVNKMPTSNLAMVFCSGLKLDRFLFNWLVDCWDLCWRGCWLEDQFEEMDNPNVRRIDINNASRTELASRNGPLVGLGISEAEEEEHNRQYEQQTRQYHTRAQQLHYQSHERDHRERTESPRATARGRKMSEPRSPPDSQGSQMYSKRQSRAFDINPAMLKTLAAESERSERGRKRDSREMGSPSPARGRPRREGESPERMDASPTYRSETAQRSEAPRTHRMNPGDRRSVDLSSLQYQLGSPAFFDPYSSRTESKLSSGSKDQNSQISPTTRQRAVTRHGDEGSPVTGLRKPRAASSERKPPTLDFLPPVPPISPLMSQNYNGGNSGNSTPTHREHRDKKRFL